MASLSVSDAIGSAEGRRSAKLRRSPLTEYCRAGNVTLRPLPPRRSQTEKPISFSPLNAPSSKCSSASANFPTGWPVSFIRHLICMRPPWGEFPCGSIQYAHPLCACQGKTTTGLTGHDRRCYSWGVVKTEKLKKPPIIRGPNGGARPGSGRKKGSLLPKTIDKILQREIIRQRVAAGLGPVPAA